MLVLTRSKGNRVVIGDDVVVTVLSVGRSRCTCGAQGDGVRVQLGVDAPRELRVLRGEIYDAVRGANLASVTASATAKLAGSLGRLVAPPDPWRRDGGAVIAETSAQVAKIG